MLIRFTVENFLSFKDEVEFSMVAGKSRRHRDHIVTTGKRSDTRLLKTATIYGANASGKTNLIRAMDYARDFILGNVATRPRQSIPVFPFLLDRSKEKAPSKFEFEVKCLNASYTYGFEVSSERVHSEWLFEIRPTTDKVVFQRETDSDGRTTVEFGSFALTAEQSLDYLQFTAVGTRRNQLFLTESMDRNVEYFRDVYDWFESKLVLIYPESTPTGIAFMFKIDAEFQSKLSELINVFDFGISRVEYEKTEFDSDTRFPDELKRIIKQRILDIPFKDTAEGVVQFRDTTLVFVVDKDNLITSIEYQTVHRVDHESRNVFFDLAQESDGTQRIFNLGPALLDLLSSESDRVFIIDELDRKLHPDITYTIVEMFLKNSGQRPRQLIITTHESGLLDLNLLRRDEIWFIEKTVDGTSSAYSLEDFVPRNDSDVRKRYLQGRFGSIPIILSVNNLEWAK